jgi:hypothetical protein
VVAFRFAFQPVYLHILVGIIVGLACLGMLCVAVEAPRILVSRIEASTFGQLLFTFRGRYIVDLFMALLLFAMGPWGIILGIFTLLLIFGIRFLGVKQPDAFNEIFRQSQIDGGESQSDEYTLEESEYDPSQVTRDTR